jgi:hypothetical protein
MTRNRITLRSLGYTIACALVVAVASQFAARATARYFAGSPAWELPVICCGTLAVLIIGFLAAAPLVAARHRG